jgi:hypothetical protein
VEPPLPVHPDCVLIRKNRRIIEMWKNWKPLEVAEKTQNVDKGKEIGLSADGPIDGTALDPFLLFSIRIEKLMRETWNR